jgi:hypothetical protein
MPGMGLTAADGANYSRGLSAGGGGFLEGLKGFGSSLNNFMGGKSFGNAMDLGGLALSGYGLKKSLGFAEDQLGILKEQENRAATAQNQQSGNALSLALQTTTPGTPEHERIKQALAQGTFQV